MLGLIMHSVLSEGTLGSQTDVRLLWIRWPYLHLAFTSQMTVCRAQTLLAALAASQHMRVMRALSTTVSSLIRILTGYFYIR